MHGLVPHVAINLWATFGKCAIILRHNAWPLFF